MKNLYNKLARNITAIACLSGLCLGLAAAGGKKDVNLEKLTKGRTYLSIDILNNNVVMPLKTDRGNKENYDIFTMDMDGSGERNITNSPDIDEYKACWTNEGNIAYWAVDSITRKDHTKDPCKYYIMHPKGRFKSQISQKEFLLLFGDAAKRFEDAGYQEEGR